MDDTKAMIKALRRIADAGERIAKALEKQDKAINGNTTVLSGVDNAAKEKEYVDNTKNITDKSEEET